MIKKVEHIGVHVKDMDASIEFYEKVIGMNLVARKKLDNGVELSFLSFAGSENVEIELIGRGQEGQPDNGIVHHIAFTVSDIEQEVARLRDLGVRLLDSETKTILNGAKIFFFFGPSGERLELFQPAE